ncbi:MAG: hypothetical protein ACTSV3_01590 [Candidatus Thorarchaeota archaeon]|nr:MAG: hypothetical protein DRP09_09455 [Candidatus Thorarchaeota archaeon]RLI58524.1 MAG: hypothetical protein DRO87_05465 [Candidatus Thorarchaeota archaeon]
MTDPDDMYPVNTLPAIAWALDVYFKAGGKYKEGGVVELIFPAGHHKELRRKKGVHEIIMWMSKKKLYVRSRCSYDKKCSANSERVDASDREAVKRLPWEGTEDRAFFKAVRKWIMRLNLDFVTLIRAFNTVCDRRVEIPLTTKWGRTFKKFDEYRRNRWPEDATPENREKFIEEVLVRVSFWIQSAAQVGALK